MATADGKLALKYVTVQNLRGFTEATIHLDETALFLVGPNNAGKTSLLRLFDLLFNWDLDRQFSQVSDDLLEELLPARETRNAARRLTVGIEVQDGRRHRALDCRDGVAKLRLSLTLNDRRLRANLGAPRRGETHDPKAQALLRELRGAMDFVHIPAGRSADSESFNAALLDAVTESLSSTLSQPGKGATKAERDAKDVLDSLDKLSGPVRDFWSALLQRLPQGWISSGTAEPEIDRGVLSRFIVEQLVLSLSTGSHDSAGVPPDAVGSGLQSLLDLHLRIAIAEDHDRRLLLAVEEPEAFLHPSAQRQLGRALSDGFLGNRTLVSTHSPLIIEEASSEQVAIVREHIVSQPHLVEADRAAVNTALLAGRGAEALFARSVLLVEGPGDREYWESLRRRLAYFDPSGAVDHCYVLEVGSNARSAPWIRLFRSYPGSPISWSVVLDSDSAMELREAANHSRIRLSERQRGAIAGVQKAVADGNLGVVEAEALRLAQSTPAETGMLLAPGDLESMMCAELSAATTAEICRTLGWPQLTPDQLAQRLGTKHRAGGLAVNSATKSPWIRGMIGRVVPASEISEFVATVLSLWTSGAAGATSAESIVRDFQLSS